MPSKIFDSRAEQEVASFLPSSPLKRKGRRGKGNGKGKKKQANENDHLLYSPLREGYLTLEEGLAKKEDSKKRDNASYLFFMSIVILVFVIIFLFVWALVLVDLAANPTKNAPVASQPVEPPVTEVEKDKGVMFRHDPDFNTLLYLVAPRF